MQHKRDPTPRSWASRPPGKGGKGVGGGPPVEKRNENYECEVEPRVNEMTLTGTLFPSEELERTDDE